MATQEYFVSLVEKHSLLWDKRHREYRNDAAKQVIWRHIADLCNLENYNAAESLFNSLRLKYIRRKNAEKNSYKNGSAAKILKPWHLYAKLKFLDDTIKPRNSVSNLLLPNQNQTVSESSYKQELAIDPSDAIRNHISSSHEESKPGSSLVQDPLFVIVDTQSLSEDSVVSPAPVTSPINFTSRPSTPLSKAVPRKRPNIDNIDKLISAMTTPVEIRETAPAPSGGSWDVPGEIKNYCMFLGYRLKNLSKRKLRKFEQIILSVLTDIEDEDE